MSHAAIQAALVAHLEAITDIGRVHDRPRYGDAFTHWTTELDGQTQIRAWEVGIDEGGVTANREDGQHYKTRHHFWKVRGWVGLVDDDGNDTGSYTTILDLAHVIADAIDADFDLGGICLQHMLCQIGEPTPVYLPIGEAQALCWSIDLALETITVTDMAGN